MKPRFIANTGCHPRAEGVTLIEVLVALLVLSIGLAGIALLHINSIRFAHSSYYTSIASSAALDFEERLWILAAGAGGACVGASEVDQVVNDLVAQWSGTDADRVVIPGLQIEVVEVDTTPTQWTDVAISLQWATSNGISEQFNYIARVICNDII